LVLMNLDTEKDRGDGPHGQPRNDRLRAANDPVRLAFARGHRTPPIPGHALLLQAHAY
jgi:hypothetical protein